VDNVVIINYTLVKINLYESVITMSEIAELAKVVQASILANAEQSTELRVNQNHLTIAVTDLAGSVKVAIESNTRLEEKVTSLESRALDRLDLVEDSVNETNGVMLLIDKRVQTLELINANTQGVNEANDKNQQNGNTIWTRVIAAISTAVAVVAVVYSMVGVKP